MKTITEEVIEKIEHGYTDEDIALLTGWDIELVRGARKYMEDNNE